MSNVVTFRPAQRGLTPSRVAEVEPIKILERRAFSSNWFRTWILRRKLAKELECQPDSVLRDVGLTRFELNAELAKPFWRL